MRDYFSEMNYRVSWPLFRNKSVVLAGGIYYRMVAEYLLSPMAICMQMVQCARNYYFFSVLHQTETENQQPKVVWKWYKKKHEKRGGKEKEE